MKIDAVDVAAALMPRPDGAGQAAQWQRALELAQWQARQRYVAQPVGAAAPPPADTVRSVVGTPPPAVAQPELAPAQTAAGASASAAVHADGSAPVPAHRLPTQAPVVKPALLAAPAASSVAEHAATSRPEPPPAHRPALLLPLPPLAYRSAPWPPFATHASIRGTYVSAAVRDARLGTTETETLRRALIRQLAADGLQLAELRVNGRLIAT